MGKTSLLPHSFGQNKSHDSPKSRDRKTDAISDSRSMEVTFPGDMHAGRLGMYGSSSNARDSKQYCERMLLYY